MRKSFRKFLYFTGLACAFLGVIFSSNAAIASNLTSANGLETVNDVGTVVIDRSDFTNTGKSINIKKSIGNTTAKSNCYFNNIYALTDNSFSVENRNNFKFILFKVDKLYRITDFEIKTIDKQGGGMRINLFKTDSYNENIYMNANTNIIKKDVAFKEENGIKYAPNELLIYADYLNQVIEFESIKISFTHLVDEKFTPIVTGSFVIDPKLLQKQTNLDTIITIPNSDAHIPLKITKLDESNDNYFTVSTKSSIYISSVHGFGIPSVSVVFDETNNGGQLRCRYFDTSSGGAVFFSKSEEIKVGNLTPVREITIAASTSTAAKVKSITVNFTNEKIDFEGDIYDQQHDNLYDVNRITFQLRHIPFHLASKVNVFHRFDKETINEVKDCGLDYSADFLSDHFELTYKQPEPVTLIIDATINGISIYRTNFLCKTKGPNVEIKHDLKSNYVLPETKIVINSKLSYDTTNETPVYDWIIEKSDPNMKYKVFNASDKSQKLEIQFLSQGVYTIYLKLTYQNFVIYSKQKLTFKCASIANATFQDVVHAKTNKYMPVSLRVRGVVSNIYDNTLVLQDFYSQQVIQTTFNRSDYPDLKAGSLVEVVLNLGQDVTKLDLSSLKVINTNKQLTPVRYYPSLTVDLTKEYLSDHVKTLLPGIKVIIGTIEKFDFGTDNEGEFKCVDDWKVPFIIKNVDNSNNRAKLDELKTAFSKNAPVSILATLEYEAIATTPTEFKYVPYFVLDSIEIIDKGLVDAYNLLEPLISNPEENTCGHKFYKARDGIIASGYVETFKNLDKDNPIYQRYTAWARALNENPWAKEKAENVNGIELNEQSYLLISVLAFAGISLVSAALFVFIKKSKKIRNQK